MKFLKEFGKSIPEDGSITRMYVLLRKTRVNYFWVAFLYL